MAPPIRTLKVLLYKIIPSDLDCVLPNIHKSLSKCAGKLTVSGTNIFIKPVSQCESFKSFKEILATWNTGISLLTNYVLSLQVTI